MTQHGPEPWNNELGEIFNANGNVVGRMGPREGFSEESIARVLACVNFCRNMQTESMLNQELFAPTGVKLYVGLGEYMHEAFPVRASTQEPIQ